MKKLAMIVALVLLTPPAFAGRSDVWRATVKKNYRSARGDNEINVSIKLVKCGGRSSLLDVELCGKPARGKTVCTELDTGRRMKQGESAGLWIKLPRTRYPIERVFVRN